MGVAFGGGEALGVFIAIAIAVHNIPETVVATVVLSATAMIAFQLTVL